MRRRMTRWEWERRGKRAPLGWALAYYDAVLAEVVIAPAPLAVFLQIWVLWLDYSIRFALSNRDTLRARGLV